MTSDPDALVAFIRDRLDEDERLALAAAAPGRFAANWRADLWFDGTGERMDLDAGPAGPLSNHGALERPTAEHAARHDPARVLRNVEAIRAILWAFELREEQGQQPGGEVFRYHATGVLTAIRHIAAIWAEHPDHRPDWSPDGR